MAKAVLAVVCALLAALSYTSAHADKRNPAWTELSQEQQRILAPIQGEWESLDAPRKRKWLGIAQRSAKMSADGQERLQRRMTEWAGLTSEQRRAARDKYRGFEQLAPEERQAVREKWDRYKREQAEKEAAARSAEKAAETDSATKAAESAAADDGAAAAGRPQ
jgi:hypothetical protein